MFADDSSMSFTSNNSDDLEGIMNHDLQIISNWAKQWLVTFNPNKTESMLFTLRTTVQSLSLMLDGTDISFVENHRHLGLTLSNNGKWHDHINNIISSSSKILGIMRKLKFQLSRTSLNQIYISYMRPILEYVSVVWDGCSDYEKSALEKIQNEAARVATGLTGSVTLDKLRQEIGWQSLSVRRNVQKLTVMYKANNDETPSYITRLIPPVIHNITEYNLRNRHNINIPHSTIGNI